MSKKYIFGLLIILPILFLSGCCLSHEWSEATCTEPATCIECGQIKGRALGHLWSESTCAVPQTCVDCNETKGETLDHTWVEATCTTAKTCSVCGEVEGEPLEHSIIASTCTSPQSCKVCGKIWGEATGHAWSAAICGEPQACTRCGITNGQVTEHKLDATGRCIVCNQQTLTMSNYQEYLSVDFYYDTIESLPIVKCDVYSNNEFTYYKDAKIYVNFENSSDEYTYLVALDIEDVYLSEAVGRYCGYNVFHADGKPITDAKVIGVEGIVIE